MSDWYIFGLIVAFLLAPWLLMPRGRSGEIRGIVRILWAVNWLYAHAWHRLEVMNRPTLPEHGPAIMISNHTCCIDHILLQAATRRLLGFVIAKELYDFWLFKPFCQVGGCIPVKRDGNDVAAMRAALRILESGKVVPVFPEGRITPSSGRELGEPKPGAAFLALRARVPVVPAYVCGTPRTNKVVWSYLSPSHARVYFGPPIDLSDLYAGVKVERDAFDEVSHRMMKAIRDLRDEAWGIRGDGSSRPTVVRDVTPDDEDDGERSERRPESLRLPRQAARTA